MVFPGEGRLSPVQVRSPWPTLPRVWSMRGAHSRPRAMVSLSPTTGASPPGSQAVDPRTGGKEGSGHDGIHSCQRQPWHCARPVEWQGAGPLGGSRYLPSPQEESSFIGTVPSPERPQPGRKKRQGFLSARGITPCSPHQDPLSGHLSGDPPPQLSLQGQGLPEARGRGLPLPPPRQ